MNLEFHYYTMVYLAIKAGFPASEAQIIGYSSQFVDNNLVSFRIRTDQGLIETSPTQNFGYWDKDTPEKIYIPFHFFPGEDSRPSPRTDGRSNAFSVVPNSPGVRELMVGAMRTENPYRIGITFHTFADTWAHQNFSGIREDWNRLEEGSLIPAIGHAQATRDPDLWFKTWQDSRLRQPSVINKARFLEAAKKIYRYLCVFRKKKFEDEDFVLFELDRSWESCRAGKTADERMLELRILWEIPVYDRSQWLDDAVHIPDKGFYDESLFEGYDKVLWFMDQFLLKSKLFPRETLVAKTGFQGSHFQRWHDAAREHRRDAQEILDRRLTGWRERIENNDLFD